MSLADLFIGQPELKPAPLLAPYKMIHGELSIRQLEQGNEQKITKTWRPRLWNALKSQAATP